MLCSNQQNQWGSVFKPSLILITCYHVVHQGSRLRGNHKWIQANNSMVNYWHSHMGQPSLPIMHITHLVAFWFSCLLRYRNPLPPFVSWQLTCKKQKKIT